MLLSGQCSSPAVTTHDDSFTMAVVSLVERNQRDLVVHPLYHHVFCFSNSPFMLQTAYMPDHKEKPKLTL